MAANLSDVIRQMAAYGIDVPDRVDLTAALRGYLRWRPTSEKKNKKTAWARLFEYTSPKSGRVYITGMFGLRGDKWEVEATAHDWTPAERAEWQEHRKAAAKAAEEARAKDAEEAAQKAEKLWNTAREEGASAYLDRKKVRAFGIRFGFNSRLMVPLRDVEGVLHGVQWISPDGDKIFGTGTRKEGHFHRIGEVDRGKPLVFVEGYATGASVHMATDWPVIVCFDAGNLEPVVSTWRTLYPELQLVVAADDDRHLLLRLCERLARYGIATTPAELGALDDEHEWTVPGAGDGGADLMVILKAGWSKDANAVPFINGTITIGGTAHQVSLGVDGDGKAINLGVPTGGRTEKVKLENAGRAAAELCAKRYRSRTFLPSFDDVASSGTDWNDLHVAQGLEAVSTQLRGSFAAPVPDKKRANERAQRGGRKAPPPADTDEVEYTDFLARYTLIYGTTTVWDQLVREIIRIESVKLAHGRLADWWLSNPKRNIVPARNVVFDPTGKQQLPEYVNLFDKLPIQPAPGACEKIVAHLYAICQENDNLFHWVCCWLALPLQRPGTKMRTALVLHGRTEGTGKSLMMTIMRRIYGPYARTITQSQLQGDFNGYMSGLLFCVAEEVVSRQDRAHHQGLLQDMITGDTVNINEKNMPLRTEANYTNFVFQSNNQVPMLLNARDRRYTVIRVEQEQSEKYFAEISGEMEAGGIAAFYQWLLDYDVGTFSPFTRPFENKDRMHLITLGMAPDQRFFQFWQSGLAGVPFVCCPANELYTAFKAWCKVQGERYTPNQTAFGRTMTEELERLRAPPKAKIRYWGASEKCVAEGDFNSPLQQLQGVVYFIQSSIERRLTAADESPPGAEAASPSEVVDVTQRQAYDERILLFQKSLHALLASARRAL